MKNFNQFILEVNNSDFEAVSRGALFKSDNFVVQMTVGKKSGIQKLSFYYLDGGAWGYTAEVLLASGKILESCPEIMSDPVLRQIVLPEENKKFTPSYELSQGISVYANTKEPLDRRGLVKDYNSIEPKLEQCTTMGDVFDIVKRLADRYKNSTKFDL